MNIRKSLYIGLLLIAAMALAACGGGGGGGGSSLSTGGFNKNIVLDGSVGSYSNMLDATPGARYQMLYRATDIKGAGIINSISLRMDTEELSAVECTNFSIRMGHTNLTALINTYANNVEVGQGTYELVFGVSTLTIPTGSAGDYFNINLDTPFNYNGVDNLVVEFSRADPCGDRVQVTTNSAATPYDATNIDTGSGSALTGSVQPTPVNITFNFAGGDNYLDSTVGSISTGNSFPFNNSAALGRKVQLLYPASDVDGSGPITGIGFPVGELTTDQIYTVTIKLGHSTLAELVTGPFADSYSGAPVTVATNLTFTIPAGLAQGDFIWLPVTGSFNYNGTDNLILEVETTDNTQATGNTLWRNRFSTGTDLRLYGDLGSATGTAIGDYYFTKFRFNGGTMDVIVDNGSGQGFPFWNTVGSIQHLYNSYQLGTAGSITRIECRADTDIVGETGLAYTITLAHTTAMDLGTTFATNLQSDVVEVYNGTFDIPVMLAGDWFGIDFTTPYSYDGTSNLVMEMRGTGGSVAVFSCRRNSGGMPNSQLLWGGADETATTGFTESSLIDARFHITR